VTTPADSAFLLALSGWVVLPCHSSVGAGCSCGRTDCSSPGKHPRTRRGLHDASSDPEMVAGWWRRWPDANVGVRTGAVSGLVVVDIDPAHGGLESIRRLHGEHRLPDGLRVRTGSGGWHLYFAHPGFEVRNSAGTVLGDGVDVRGDGGYVIAPPSRHIAGGVYEWVGPWVIPDLPDHLLERVRPRPQPAPPPARPASHRPGHHGLSWAESALADEAHQVRTAAQGGRNHRLNRASFSLGQIVAGGLLDADTVTDELRHAALGAGLGARESALTIRSGLRAGMLHPRRPPDRSPGDPSPPSVDAGVEIDL